MYYAQRQGLGPWIKNNMKKGLDQLAQAFSLSFWQKKAKVAAFFPFYHAVEAEPQPHISPLYPLISPAQFEAELELILAHFEPIGLGELLAWVEAGRPARKPFFHLSFDDGLSSCYHIIAPILLRLGVPATFFINGAFVDNKRLMFRHLAALIYSHLEVRKELRRKDAQLLFSAGHAQETALLAWAERVGCSVTDFLAQKQPYLKLEELKALDRMGFSIGGHSWDHPLYKKLSLEEQILQTENNQQQLAACLPQPIRAFAFPFTDHEVELAFFERANLDLSFGGAGIKEEMQLGRHIQRFPMEEMQIRSAEQKLKSAFAYGSLLRTLGKSKIDRSPAKRR